MTEPIRVLIADDHPIVREGLRTFLEMQPGIEVVGEAADGDDTVAKTERLLPDVLLLDLKMPGMNGFDALRELRRRQVATKVLVLTSVAEKATVLPAVRFGVFGYLYKDVDPLALAQAIRSVHEGHVLLAAEAADSLLRAGERQAIAVGDLTEREREVLAEIASGKTNREIARALAVTEKTVKTHVSSVLTKLGLADRTQAALYAVRHGLAER